MPPSTKLPTSTTCFWSRLGYVSTWPTAASTASCSNRSRRKSGASDFLMGLIGGLAFSVCHSVATIPIARLADRWSRVKVLSLAVTVWSLATAACGLAWSYFSLLFGRALTAIGEAGGTPPSHALISDYFAPSKRATALAAYAMAVPIGMAVGNYGSGWFNEWYGWRTTFVLARLARPARRVADLAHGQGAAARLLRRPDRRGARTAAAVLRRLSGSCYRAIPSCTCRSARRCTPWSGTRAPRSMQLSFSARRLSPGETGSYIAVFSLIGALGSFAGGYLADRISSARTTSAGTCGCRAPPAS